ncbi:hypothetical protein TKK_0010254 [Trichogramma kaykai]|uniref:TAFII55 protein conserved region domain-containing protein n=1 Tax=Trichogramma kaykai TaxID=54128 RepID=A0ABD2WYG6_9HYME
MSSNEDETNTETGNQPHVYLQFPPSKIGDKVERKIMPMTAMPKKFDYEAFKNKHTIYENKHFKINENGLKRKCFFLYAADTYDEVYTASKKPERFRIPTHTDTIEDSSLLEMDLGNGSTNENDDQQVLQKTKKQKKASKKAKSSNQKDNQSLILDKYLQQNEMMNQLIQQEIGEVEQFDNREFIPASSPNAAHSNTNSNGVLDYKKIIAGLRSQLNDARFEIAQLKKELGESNTSNANASNRENRACKFYFKIVILT